MKLNIFIFLIMVSFISCSETPVSTDAEEAIFSLNGLVDSIVVHGCYSHTLRYFTPTSFDLKHYSHIKISFNGFSNSDGSSVSIFYNTDNLENINVYNAYNQAGINKTHSFMFPSSKSLTWFEIRLYINPPVCGKGEFKYISVRDLKITGIK